MRLKPVPKTTLAARIMELERVLRQRVNGKKDRHDVAKDFLHRILSRGEHKDPKLRKARPAANPFASWASRRALLTPQVNPGSLAIAAARALKCSLCAAAGGKRA